MKTRLLATAAAVFLLASPALAFHCPLDVAAIDNGLAKADVGADVKAEVKALRDEGEALHNAGKHAEAVEALSQAMRRLLNAM